jgi:hypothetical protein
VRKCHALGWIGFLSRYPVRQQPSALDTTSSKERNTELSITAASPIDRVLRVTVVLCFVLGIIALTDYFSLFRAIAVMLGCLSPLVFAYGYFLNNRSFARIGISMLLTGVLFWLINADMGWQDRYCILSPFGC